MTPNKKVLDLDSSLEAVARKVRPGATVYTVNPSACETQACDPQCDCCSGPNPTDWTSASACCGG